jgi:hypothetical protein
MVLVVQQVQDFSRVGGLMNMIVSMFYYFSPRVFECLSEYCNKINF